MDIPKPNSQCLLIAMPTLIDPFFGRTTTLLHSFTKEGAMGFILNRPLKLHMSQLLGKEIPKDFNAPIYWGGPVQPERGWILHREPALEKESISVAPGLFLTSSDQALQTLTATSIQQNLYRMFLGYAGWDEGQLEKEMSESSWVTAPIQSDFVFDLNPETIWERSLQSIGVSPDHLAPSDSSTLQ